MRTANSLLATSSRIAVLNDIHIGIHDEAATRVIIEAFEHTGVDCIVANGDIHDCAAVSSHAGKKKRAALETGQLAEEAASGRWIVDWMTTRPCVYGVGNHEDWINDLALDSNTVGTVTVASALGLPTSDRFVVAPHGYQLRLGSLVIEHGDIALGRSSGGQHLAANLLRRYPTQTTVVGHFHHQDYAVHTTGDTAGRLRSHAAYCVGHLSRSDAHSEYAGRLPNWQQGAALIDVWWDGSKPRFTIHLLEVHRDRRNRPMVEFGGKVFR